MSAQLNIAHGFHYPDGHEYKHSNTYGYIISTDSNGQQKHQYNHHGTGHVFIHDLIQNGEFIFAVGAHQSTHSGMDILLLKLDSHLKLKSEKILAEEGIQEAHLIKLKDEQIFIAGTSENMLNHKMKCHLISLDSESNIKWTSIIEDEGSCRPQDLIINENKLILLVESKASRTSDSKSLLYTFSLQGTSLQELEIY